MLCVYCGKNVNGKRRCPKCHRTHIDKIRGITANSEYENLFKQISVSPEKPDDGGCCKPQPREKILTELGKKVRIKILLKGK